MRIAAVVLHNHLQSSTFQGPYTQRSTAGEKHPANSLANNYRGWRALANHRSRYSSVSFGFPLQPFMTRPWKELGWPGDPYFYQMLSEKKRRGDFSKHSPPQKIPSQDAGHPNISLMFWCSCWVWLSWKSSVSGSCLSPSAKELLDPRWRLRTVFPLNHRYTSHLKYTTIYYYNLIWPWKQLTKINKP